jgi:hypothetical protein
MSKLKPIGSEKLKGQEQIKRILEIAKYKEHLPNSINESARTDYNTKLVDGNVYFIVKEKMGYTIKKGLNESTADYIEPMKNRKYFDSYADAMKKLNLVAQELNRVNHINEGISLFTEDKKYFLKTPKPETTDEAAPEMAPPPPPPAPSPEEMPAPPAEDEMPSEGPDAPEGDMSPEDSMPDEPTDEMPDEGPEEADDEVPTYKSIQKLTGKLAQKIRDFKGGDEEMTSKDAKYVINSILSSITDLLDDEDKEDIITKLEDSEGEEDMSMGMEDEEEMPTDEMPAEEGGEEEMPSEEPKEMTEEEMNEKYVERALQSIFKESTVDKVLSQYFVINENEKKFTETKKQNKKTYLKNKKNSDKQKIRQLSESLKQKNVASEIISSFPEMKFVGKTNLGNLVFEHNNKQLKVSPKGELL